MGQKTHKLGRGTSRSCLCCFLAGWPPGRRPRTSLCLLPEVRVPPPGFSSCEKLKTDVPTCVRMLLRDLLFPGPGLRPPLGLREYAPGIPPGKRDLPLDPREFLPGHTPFRPLGSLGPREYFIPGTRPPPPTHGPQDYPPPPAARDFLPSGSRDEPPAASQSSSPDCSQALKQSP